MAFIHWTCTTHLALTLGFLSIAGLIGLSGSDAGASTVAPELPCTSQVVQQVAEQELGKYVGENLEPGVSLAIYLPLRFKEPVVITHGYADFEKHSSLSADQRMLAGSIGKTLFAAAALRLADQGRLDLDRPISSILPTADIPHGNIVTPRMLLSHTSGYGEYDGQFMQDLIAEPLRKRTLDDWTGPIRRAEPDRPGKFRYSDINFVVLAAVIEAAAGAPAEQYIVDELLRPYGLNDTGPSNSTKIESLVPGYAGPENFFGRDKMTDESGLIYNPQFESGGGGFATTAPDLARWITLFSVGNFFSKPRWQEALAPIHVDDRTGKGYGLGIHVDPTPMGTAYGHSGYIPGYYSWARWYPSANIAVAIQTNSSDDARVPWDGYDISNDLAKTLDSICN